MEKNKRFWSITLVIVTLLIFSACALPGMARSGEPQPLQLTVDALSTVVERERAAATRSAAQVQPPAPAAPAQPQAQPPDPATPVPSEVPPTPTVTVELTATPIAHIIRPGQPGWVSGWFIDTNSSITAADKRAPGGDNYPKNIYERPFTATDMIYRPDLDINKVEISADTNFIYITIFLNGTNPQTGALQGLYGVELDSNLDGRGNYLLLASNPAGAEWKMENVTVYKDSGKKVGGLRPMISDAISDYIGYDQEIFSLQNLQDPDMAWARVSPKGNSIVELAFKKGLTAGSAIFLWNVWTDDGVKDPKKFDYNDHFTASDAGSPYQDANYPLKALAQMDNTCREAFGFTPNSDIPGLCSLPPTATPEPTATRKPTRLPTRVPTHYPTRFPTRTPIVIK